MGRHVAQLGTHYPDFEQTCLCCVLSGAAAHTHFILLGLNRQGLEASTLTTTSLMLLYLTGYIRTLYTPDLGLYFCIYKSGKYGCIFTVNSFFCFWQTWMEIRNHYACRTIFKKQYIKPWNVSLLEQHNYNASKITVSFWFPVVCNYIVTNIFRINK